VREQGVPEGPEGSCGVAAEGGGERWMVVVTKSWEKC
jgi:hypothetical protein